MLKSASGLAMVVVNDSGIYITNGQATVTLVGPTVTMNNGALVVT